MGDAHRAVYYAPQSAAAHNTLGTIMQALGQDEAARSAYELASALDPKAAYAVTISAISHSWAVDSARRSRSAGRR